MGVTWSTNIEWQCQCSANTLTMTTVSNGPIVLEGHRGGVTCVTEAKRRSGDLVICSGSTDSTVILWKVEPPSFALIGKLIGHSDYISCLAVATIVTNKSEDNGNDGNDDNNDGFGESEGGTFDVLFTGSADHDIRKWDLVAMETEVVLKGHQSLINRLQVIKTDEFGKCESASSLFSSSYDHTVRSWDIKSGQPIRVFEGHYRGVYPILILSLDEELSNTAKSLAPPVIHTPKHNLSKSIAAAAGATGKNTLVLLTGSADCTIRLWMVDSGHCLHTLRGHKGAVVALTVAVINNNRIMYSGSTDGTVRAWPQSLLSVMGIVTNIADNKSGSLLLPGRHKGPVLALQTVYENNTNAIESQILQTVSDNNNNNNNNNIIINNSDPTNATNNIKRCLSSTFLLSSGADRIIKVWNLADNSCLRNLQGFQQPVNRMLALQVGPHRIPSVISSCGDGLCRCHDIRTGRLLGLYTGHQSNITDIKVFTTAHCNHDSRTSSSSTTIGSPYLNGVVHSSTQSPQNASWLVTASLDCTLRIWPLVSSPQLATLSSSLPL